jgi:hypothetical protein
MGCPRSGSSANQLEDLEAPLLLEPGNGREVQVLQRWSSRPAGASPITDGDDGNLLGCPRIVNSTRWERHDKSTNSPRRRIKTRLISYTRANSNHCENGIVGYGPP